MMFAVLSGITPGDCARAPALAGDGRSFDSSAVEPRLPRSRRCRLGCDESLRSGKPAQVLIRLTGGVACGLRGHAAHLDVQCAGLPQATAMATRRRPRRYSRVSIAEQGRPLVRHAPVGRLAETRADIAASTADPDASSASAVLPVPPTDKEKYSYVRRRQLDTDDLHRADLPAAGVQPDPAVRGLPVVPAVRTVHGYRHPDLLRVAARRRDRAWLRPRRAPEDCGQLAAAVVPLGRRFPADVRRINRTAP